MSCPDCHFHCPVCNVWQLSPGICAGCRRRKRELQDGAK